MNYLLEPDTDAATSDPVTVAAGSPATVCLVCATLVPQHVRFDVRLVTEEAPLIVATLTRDTPALLLVAPGEYEVVRPDLTRFGVEVGVGCVGGE